MGIKTRGDFIKMSQKKEKKGLKIVTIGGGSSYTPELIEGFIKRIKELPVTEIWLKEWLKKQGLTARFI